MGIEKGFNHSVNIHELVMNFNMDSGTNIWVNTLHYNRIEALALGNNHSCEFIKLIYLVSDALEKGGFIEPDTAIKVGEVYWTRPQSIFRMEQGEY